MRSSMAPRKGSLTIFSALSNQCRYRPSVGGMGNKLDPILRFHSTGTKLTCWSCDYKVLVSRRWLSPVC